MCNDLNVENSLVRLVSLLMCYDVGMRSFCYENGNTRIRYCDVMHATAVPAQLCKDFVSLFKVQV